MKEELYIKKNSNLAQRVLRVIIGMVLIGWPASVRGSPWAIALSSAAGGGLIFEGITGYCLLYGIFGWSTLPKEKV
jgi:hypothetical protein